MRRPQVQSKPPAATAPVKLSPDVTLMVRALAWFKRVSVADLTRPHLVGPMTAEFEALPEAAKRQWLDALPAESTTA